VVAQRGAVAELPPRRAALRPRAALRLRPWAVALSALLALAAALRFLGIDYGTPLPLLNPDEKSIVPRAWAMVHGGGLDPHWFDYPTLLLYLLAPFQAWQAAPSYLDARIVVGLLGVASVAASGWLGLRAYGRTAGVVAAAAVAVETTHVAYSHAAVTDVPLTLGIVVALTLMVTNRIELAGLAAGVAVGTKYPGVFLLVPLVVAGWREWRRLGIAVVLAVVAFAASSPFFLVDFGQAVGDAWRVQRLAHQGWLGFEHDGIAPIAFLDRLWEGFGPALAVAVVGLAIALIRRRREDLVLGSFVLVYFLGLMPAHAHFARYVLPLVPPLAVLAGRVRALAPVTLALLVVPLVWSVQDDLRLTRTDTRTVARAWIDRHVPRGTTIAVDPSTPPLPRFHVLPLELPGPGRKADPNRSVARLEGRGVRYVLVTGAVADRVLAAGSRYPAEARFYAQLHTGAKREYYLAPGNGLEGPWIALFRLYS
jgi:hypothetical protein